MYLLRKHLGISAREAYAEIPLWELNALLESLDEDLQAQRAAADELS